MNDTLSGFAIELTAHVLAPAYGEPTGYGFGFTGSASHRPSISVRASCTTKSLPIAESCATVNDITAPHGLFATRTWFGPPLSHVAWLLVTPFVSSLNATYRRWPSASYVMPSSLRNSVVAPRYAA